jgi:hypothetical protein
MCVCVKSVRLIAYVVQVICVVHIVQTMLVLQTILVVCSSTDVRSLSGRYDFLWIATSTSVRDEMVLEDVFSLLCHTTPQSLHDLTESSFRSQTAFREA